MSTPATVRGVTLIVAEKPSVGRDLARVVGARTRQDGYLEGPGVRVSWCIGHLAELCEPHEYDAAWKRWSLDRLPMVPESFRVRPGKGAAKQLRVLRAQLRAPDVARVVNACDAGREGELIFRYVYELTGCGKPVERLWISSLTPEAIRAGMARLRPGSAFDRLADAARCRAEADWLVGMNATRAMTCVARGGGGKGVLLSIGRVQTPTLALIVRREQAIESFVSEPYWQVRARFEPGAGAASYEGLWHRTGSNAADQRSGRSNAADQRSGRPGHPSHRSSWLESRERAEAIAAEVAGRPGRVARVDRKTERERPPLLYDLTTLQKTANRRYGMSAKRTLAAAQALYERRKAITYPRTDSRHLTGDMAGELPAILDALARPPYAELAAAAAARGVPRGKRMIDDSEVGDHHAIVPTAKPVDVEALTTDERRIYDLVARRFLAGFLADAVFARTILETVVTTETDEHRFISRGRVRLESGWHAAEPPAKPTTRGSRARSGPPDPAAPPPLPDLDQGHVVHTAAAEVRDNQTEPPRRYSEASLLASMEKAGRDLDDEALRRALKDAGLGTPATRAAIIETLLSRGYVRREGRVLHPTASGRALVAAVPVDDLLSAELTGAWEQKLADIASGRLDRPRFMREVGAFIARTVEAIARATPPEVGATEAEVLGRCPVCGADVTEGFKTYACATGKACSFVIFKRVAGRAISAALVGVLLGRGRSQVLRGFRSKRGKRFAAALELTPEGKVSMVFDRKRRPGGSSDRTGQEGERPEANGRRSARRVRSRAGASPEHAGKPRCPACRKGRIIAGRRGWGCSRWREECRFVVWFEQRGFRVPDDEAERLFRRGQTRLMDGLSPHGRARLVLDLDGEGNVRIELGKRARDRKPC